MQANLNRFDRGARLFFGALLLILSFSAFQNPLSKLVVILAGLWIVLEGATGACPFFAALGHKKPREASPRMAFELMVAGVQAAIGYVWWHAGWTNAMSGRFEGQASSYARELAAANPHWFWRNCLLNMNEPYASFLARSAEFAQYLIGIGLIAMAVAWLLAKEETLRRASLYLSAIGLAVGAIMNGLFYLTVGHIDAWVASANVVMFWIELLLLYGYVSLLMNRNTTN